MHGIDVSELYTKDTYKNFIYNQARSSNVVFVAVSHFLRNKFVKLVPHASIKIIGNIVESQKFEDSFNLNLDKVEKLSLNGSKVKLLSVGRSIALKGHAYVVAALEKLRKHHGIDAELTLVIPDEGIIKKEIKDYIKDKKIEYIKILDAVDFRVNSDFHGQFDIFVMSSYEDRERAETFGMVTVEAILAGLLVIATDAGATPEVIPASAPSIELVEPKSSESIANAVIKLLGKQISRLHLENAKSKTEIKYSKNTFFRKLNKAISEANNKSKMEISAPKIGLVSGILNGAGNAAFNTFKKLSHYHGSVELFSADRKENVNLIYGNGSIRTQKEVKRPGNTRFTVENQFDFSQTLIKNLTGFDIINIHWSAKYLSSCKIAILSYKRPIVFTVRDYHNLLGGCHFTHGLS